MNSILIIDDETEVLSSLKLLFDPSYTVHLANSGEKGLQILRDNPTIDVLICDQRMPSMTGVQVLKESIKIAPDCVRLLLTGYTDTESLSGSVNIGEVFRFIEKPWNKDELMLTVAEAIKVINRRKFGYTRASKEIIDKALEQMQVVIVVDDDRNMLETLSVTLGKYYAVNSFDNAIDAIDFLKDGTQPAVIISDQRMPKISGTDFLLTAQKFSPLSAKILVTAYTDIDDIIRLINKGEIFRYIQKPFDQQLFLSAVKQGVKLYIDRQTNPLLIDVKSDLVTTEPKKSIILPAKPLTKDKIAKFATYIKKTNTDSENDKGTSKPKDE